MGKIKKPTRKQLVKKLDVLTSKTIRELEPLCVLCGSDQGLGAGHIFSRRNLSTRWDITPEGNVHTQCWPCNYKHVRDQYPYLKWFESKYGFRALENLRLRHDQTTHLKDWELQERIANWNS